MTALGRAFLAVVPPPAVLDAVRARVAPLHESEPRLKWARRDQWHFTLQFLGPVPDLEGLVAALDAGLASRPPVTLRLGGGGAFRSPARATVVWVGLAEGGPELVDLAGAVAAATAAVGVAPEPRPFTPHLTLARAGRPRNLVRLVESVGEEPIGPAWTADAVTLIESDTRPDGAVYTDRARFALGGPPVR